MKDKKTRRAADPLWLLCCTWWDRLLEPERRQVIQVMRLLVEKRMEEESPDEAGTPEER